MDLAGSLFTFQFDRCVPIHYSVQEYLTNLRFINNPSISRYFTSAQNAHHQLATSCISYLHLDIFTHGPASDKMELSSRFQSSHNPTLARYSSLYFDAHILELKIIPQDLADQIEFLLKMDHKTIAAILQCRRLEGGFRQYYSFPTFAFPVNATSLIYLTALYDIPQFNGPETIWAKISPPKFTIHNAIRYGSPQAVSRLLDSRILFNIDVNERDEDGMSPLQLAAQRSDLNIIKRLVDEGVHIDMPYGPWSPWCSALAIASGNGDLSIVEFLLNNGPNVKLVGGEYVSALAAASYAGRLAVIELLLDRGANTNLADGEYGTALAAASYRGDLAVVQLLLDRGANINLVRGEYGTALAAASYKAEVAVIELLLDRGANINLVGGKHGSALEAACYSGKLDIAEILLKNGADVNLEGQSGGTPLTTATRLSNGYIGMMELLLKHAADPNLCPKQYPGGPLEASCYSEDSEAAQLLLERGATITSNALLAASGKNCRNDSILDLLLTKGGVATSEALVKAVKDWKYERCLSLLNYGAVITSDVVVAAWKKRDIPFTETWISESRFANLLIERGSSGGLNASVLEEAGIKWAYAVEEYENEGAERAEIQDYFNVKGSSHSYEYWAKKLGF
jgi:ankyrin repeat protein